jgi:hypothetical protein
VEVIDENRLLELIEADPSATAPIA